MRYDELLEKMDKPQALSIQYTGLGSEIEILTLIAFRNALRTVVELHKPFDADIPRCSRCMDATTENGKYEIIMSPYPCETIRTIEKKLV